MALAVCGVHDDESVDGRQRYGICFLGLWREIQVMCFVADTSDDALKLRDV